MMIRSQLVENFCGCFSEDEHLAFVLRRRTRTPPRLNRCHQTDPAKAIRCCQLADRFLLSLLQTPTRTRFPRPLEARSKAQACSSEKDPSQSS